MNELENPEENPCWGCGPKNARGLHLRFHRTRTADGVDEVVTRYSPSHEEIGWPGLLHSGLHFGVLFEVSYWAALELTGRVHTAHGTQTFDQKRLPRVGAPFVARARIERAEDGSLRTRAVSETEEGKHLATFESAWRGASRAAVERAGLKLPSYLLNEMDP